MDFVLIAGLVVSWLLLIIFGVVMYQLILQNGRTLMRLELLERFSEPLNNYKLGVPPYLGSLPLGVTAPTISLPDLNGTQRNLSEWRGKRVLLVFFDPNCTFCRNLLPSLAALPADVVPGRPVPVVISTGDRETNRALFDGAGFTSQVLLQTGTDVAAAYKVDGTPMSYIIEADGTVATEVAVGIQMTLHLAGDIGAVNDATSTYHTNPANRVNQPPLSNAVTVDTGLREGATAPIFRLPRLDGGELSLLDYRGRQVVLVFSDPECGPCDTLAPLLEATHRRQPDLALLMISRGEPEATQAKVAEYEFSFPVALQRHWEISREYGIFAAPTAFLIDEWGVIGADVAAGPEAIMDLIARAVG